MSFTYLLTGASGFLGKEIRKELTLFGTLTTLGRSVNNSIVCNLSEQKPKISKGITTVIHCAGKAHIEPKSKKDEIDFFKVNFEGTINLLAGLDDLDRKPKRFIFISSVAVYGLEKGENISENHPLLGKTPYAKSKILAEKEVEKWCEKHAVQYLILRLPLVIGKYPKGNLLSISEAIKKGRYIRIKNNHAKKSIVFASDVAQLIKSWNGVQGTYNLTDGNHPSFSRIERQICKIHKQKILFSLPKEIAHFIGYFGDLIEFFGIPFMVNTEKIKKVTSTLTFSDEKARNKLSWKPKSSIKHFELS